MANNNSSNLAGFGNFAQGSFAGNSFLPAAADAPLTEEEFLVFKGVKELTPSEEKMFKREIQEIRQLIAESKAIAKRINNANASLVPAQQDFQMLGVLPLGDTSFRGKNGPQVYLAPTANGKDVEVRVNFSVDGRPFRVSHPSSFNAALAAMKGKRGNATAKLGKYKRAINLAKGISQQAHTEYNAKQKEIASLSNKLAKLQAEYRARKGTPALAIPSSVPGQYSQSIVAAEQGYRSTAAPVTVQKRSLLSRLNPFAKRNNRNNRNKKGGATRRRSASRKTRKGRKGSRK